MAYTTGWIRRTVWANTVLGSSQTLNAISSVQHDLGRDLTRLKIELYWSLTGSDTDALQLPLGWGIEPVDINAFRLTTQSTGPVYQEGGGVRPVYLINIDGYYKIDVLESEVGISVSDEGIVVRPTTISLNFIGADVTAVASPTPGQVDVYIPGLTFVSHFNTTDGDNICTVAPASTTSRYISNPGSFGIGGWTAGTIHDSVNNLTSLAFDTVNNCSFEDQTTTITVNIAGADDNFGAPIATVTTPVLTTTNTPYDVTVSGIRIRVDAAGGPMISDLTKFQARIRVDININTIIGDSGRFSIQIVHNNIGAVNFEQGPLFYDAQQALAPGQDPAIGDSVTIAETGGSVVTRFLSGVEYYDLGSQFTVNIGDIDWLNSDSYPTQLIQLIGPEYGLPNLTVSQGDALLVAGGWTNDWNDQDTTYNYTAWGITATNYYYLGTTANVTAQTLDTWNAGGTSSDDSPDAAVAIETHISGATRLYEDFYTEAWRCALTGNFDLPAQRGWTSNVDIAVGDACYYNGRCGRRAFNYTPYSPNAAGQPDYSVSQDATVYVIREFQHDGTASSNGRLYISGTFTSLELKMAKAWDGTPTGGTVWISMLNPYNFSQWNNGNPLAGTGCQTGSGTGYIDFTFGSLNILNTNNTIYIRVGFQIAEEITTFNVSFT